MFDIASERNSKCLSEKLKIHLRWKDMQYSFRLLVFCNVMIRQFVSYKSSRTINKCSRLQNHCPHSKGGKVTCKTSGFEYVAVISLYLNSSIDYLYISPAISNLLNKNKKCCVHLVNYLQAVYMILLQVYINTAVWEERLKVVICNLLNHGAFRSS